MVEKYLKRYSEACCIEYSDNTVLNITPPNSKANRGANGEIFTPLKTALDIVDEMINMVGIEELYSIKSADVFAGYGQLTLALMIRFEECGYDVEYWVNNNVILYEFNEVSIEKMNYIFPNSKVSCVDLLKGDVIDLDADNVYGNPPYNNRDLYFMRRYWKNDFRYITLIHPSSWILQNKRNVSKIVRDTRNNTMKKIVSLRMFNGNAEFGIKIAKSLLITCIDKHYNGKINVLYLEEDSYVAGDYSDISVHGSKWITLNLKHWINICDQL